MRKNTAPVFYKPFVKWVGGKGQLLSQLETYLPADFSSWEKATYIEPFVGGGAMLFHMLNKYKNISKAIINDINPDLVTAYRTIKKEPGNLISFLKGIEREYLSIKHDDDRKAYYLSKRELYNKKGHSQIENTGLFIFLNRTCFNGLYRVNRKGQFNVPFGRYSNPTICDDRTIWLDSEILQNVEILQGDYTKTIDFADKRTLFYFDPPYRPISATSNFNDYAKEAFGDNEQIRLREFCDKLDEYGYSFMLSNSDGVKVDDVEDDFMDMLYSKYIVERVFANRNINANASKRGKLTEILVRNYPLIKKDASTYNKFDVTTNQSIVSVVY